MAVSTAARATALPDVPTLGEFIPGFEARTWQGLGAPKHLPAQIVDTLNKEVIAALAEPKVRQRLADIGQEIFPREQQNPPALAAMQKAEIEKWWPIIKAAGIKAE